jgi:hypothetical protein
MPFLFLALFATGISTLIFVFLFSNKISEDEKELFILGSLGSPVVFPVLAIISWILFFIGFFNG